MKDTKRRFEAFSFFDHTGIQAHLEEMAAKGWMVEQPGPYLWRYRRIEPQRLHFAVTYFPAASEFDPGPAEGQQTYQDYCESAGWHLSARWGQMQIFCTAEEDPVPLETDALTQVDTVHRTMKRSSLPGMAVVAALALFQVCFQLRLFWEDPVDFLSTPSSLYALPAWLVFLGVELYELLFYFRWYKRARALAEATGEFLPIRTHRRLSLLLLAVAFLFFLSAALEHTRSTLFAMLFWLAVFVLILLLINAAKSALKGLQAPRAVTRAVTVIMSVVLAAALTGGMTALIFRGIRSGWLEDRRPAETYEYRGMAWKVYADDIPLRIENLTDTDYTRWSTEAGNIPSGPGWTPWASRTWHTTWWRSRCRFYTAFAKKACWSGTGSMTLRNTAAPTGPRTPPLGERRKPTSCTTSRTNPLPAIFSAGQTVSWRFASTKRPRRSKWLWRERF